MKFGYNADGKLVPIEELELRAKIAELEAQLDDPAARAEVVAGIRRMLVDTGQPISAEDENVLALYQESVLDYHNVEHHFGPRLVAAFMNRPRGRSDAA